MIESGFNDRARLLGALANEKRLQILRFIAGRETAVGDLAEQVGLSQSALSQHLAKLKAANFVTARRQAQTIYYSTEHPGVCRMLKTLEELGFHPPAEIEEAC
ncbi:ArsR/SmtB family transcription factor [Agrobacterium sp. Azo12]|uniref:ArsR/SmtB family transcription factor n=1 Tax=Agrobacterium sp. Azo12 TaxID=3031129 RepID=UPI0023D87A51|nr:metalloregulator ArsR/SmtB family transcription factor [Agrobacterium sp. Azo12]MDO5897209.1 metalloregulator ArsR/SmtB family transcription factor [Agrobacterium sp. Azo12]